MIRLLFPDTEYYDDVNNEFLKLPRRVIDFEFSLKAVYQWEGKWKKPFLGTDDSSRHTPEQLMDFYLLMADDKTLSEEYITPEMAEELSEYLSDSQTATRFNVGQNENTSVVSKVYTSEELYALMFMNGIPMNWENNNLNRLLVMLRIISIYNNPPKKMSKQDLMQQNRRLNEERKAKYKTRG